MIKRRGGDFDLTPELRVSGNANHLWFEDTATLQALKDLLLSGNSYVNVHTTLNMQGEIRGQIR